MAVTGTRTVRSIVNGALRKAGLLDIAEEGEAELVEVGVEHLDEMLKAWQAEPWIWTRTSGTLTLTTAASYTLSPVRPLRILSARLVRSGVETPMEQLTRREYDELPLKTSTGLPTTFFYDRQREAALFHVWPVLASAAGETIAYTYVREVEDAALNDVIDVPAEWYEATTLGLAARLAMTFGRPVAQTLFALAEASRKRAAAAEMDEPVYFEAEWR